MYDKKAAGIYHSSFTTPRRYRDPWELCSCCHLDVEAPRDRLLFLCDCHSIQFPFSNPSE